jgi:hypothetical protein
MVSSEKIESKLRDLEDKRKKGEINSCEFYKGLMELLVLVKEELQKEDIDERLAKRQIPFLLSFIKNQIKEFKSRDN